MKANKSQMSTSKPPKITAQTNRGAQLLQAQRRKEMEADLKAKEKKAKEDADRKDRQNRSK